MQRLSPALLLAGLTLAFGAGVAAAKDQPGQAPTPIGPLGPVALERYRGIYLDGSPEFVAEARRTLASLDALPTGRRLLDELIASGKPITLTETDEPNGVAIPDDEDAGTLRPDGRPSPGSGGVIEWNPEFGPGGLPPAIILAHELIHMRHFTRGEGEMEQQEDGRNESQDLEELRTIGVPSEACGRADPITENRLRQEWNIVHGAAEKLPFRLGHDDMSGPFDPPQAFVDQLTGRDEGPDPRGLDPRGPGARDPGARRPADGHGPHGRRPSEPGGRRGPASPAGASPGSGAQQGLSDILERELQR
ncbi:MAG: M91 family zinc metallopeptidase [Planctomycetota bacterium]